MSETYGLWLNDDRNVWRVGKNWTQRDREEKEGRYEQKELERNFFRKKIYVFCFNFYVVCRRQGALFDITT